MSEERKKVPPTPEQAFEAFNTYLEDPKNCLNASIAYYSLDLARETAGPEVRMKLITYKVQVMGGHQIVKPHAKDHREVCFVLKEHLLRS